MRTAHKVALVFLFPLTLGPIADDSRADGPDTPQTDVKTPARIDKDHPPIVRSYEYPLESRRQREQGVCAVRLQVDRDGFVRAMQLVASTDYQRLDVACLAAFEHAQFIPATLNGQPVPNWINVPLAFRLWPAGGPAKAVTDDQLRVPIVQKEYGLKIGPDFYPAASRELHQEGDCAVRVLVKEDGTVSNMSVTKSTGFATLDQACIAAIQQAPFVPAHAKEMTVAAFADIHMSWRLPTK
jgi:TonB family protein